MRFISLFFIIINSLFSSGFQLNQQTGIYFVEITHSWVFGENIQFKGTIMSGSPVKEAALFIRPSGADTQLINFQPARNGKFTQTIDLTENPMRAFTPVEYWYQIELETGEKSTSQIYSFLYEDNRFEWQRMTSENFDIAWTTGDLEFGQTLMNATIDSLAAAQATFPVELPSPLRVYVYPSATELQSAVNAASLPWSAGHTDPETGVILLSISPGPDSRAEMERQIPHEIMHLLEYQYLGTAYQRAPMWLLEGLATNAELYPNPEYQQVLQKAVSEDSLIPIIVLCDNFPRDLSGAMLAYAESSSFVRYLHQNYGSTGIATLLDQYKDGLRCEAGVQAATGTSLVAIEGRWQSGTLGHNAYLAAWKQIRPYLLLAFIILIPVGLSLIPGRRKQKKQEN